METHCPHCDTRYDVDDDVLTVCGGEVRCFRCERVFNVLAVEAGYQVDTGQSQIPNAAAAATPQADADRLVIELHHAPDEPADEAPADAPPTRPEVAAERSMTEDDVHQATDATTPFDLPDPQAPSEHHWLGTLFRASLIFILTLGALAQWGWLERNRLLAQPEIRSLLAQLGDRFGTPITTQVDPKQFSILRRDLAPDVERDGALLLRAVARNDSRLTQPLPALQLTLFDSAQNIVARRTFSPTHYLRDPTAAQPIAPQQVFTLELAFEDPGDRASGFELTFY